MMKRFTSKNKDGKNTLVLKNAVECIGEDDISKWYISNRTTGTNIIEGDAIDRFAEYEDLGLEPSQLAVS